MAKKPKNTGKKTKKKVLKKQKREATKKIKNKVGKKIQKKKSISDKPVKKRINILSSKGKVKKEIIRVQTGISVLDDLMEGGFDKDSTNILVGNPGSGKTILATQFLIGGMKKGEKCLYVTFEEKKDQFYANMKRFGWNLEEYEKKGLFSFLEYTPEKVKTMLEEGGGTIESTIIKKKISRVVIDSITSFSLLFEEEIEKREAALSLFSMISGWNCTSLLTVEGEPIKDQKMAARALEFESDGIILLYFIRDKNERKRYIEILKMRGTKHSKKVHGFAIEKNGIEIQKRPASLPMALKRES